MQELLAAIRNRIPAEVAGLRASARALFIARAAEHRQRLLCITPDFADATALKHDLSLFTDRALLLYPNFEIPPYAALTPDPKTIAERLATLYELITTDRPFILIAPVEAMLRRIMPRQLLSSLAELVIRGEETDQQDLAARLLKAGYDRVSLVQLPGEVTVRGGIMDVFSPGHDCPLRLDFFGDTIESIRYFDPISQRSVEELGEAVLLPAKDILYPPEGSPQSVALLKRLDEAADKHAWDPDEHNRIREQFALRSHFPGLEFFLPLFHEPLSTPFEYLPDDTAVFLLDPLAIRESVAAIWKKIRHNHQEVAAHGGPALAPGTLFLLPENLADEVAGWRPTSIHAIAGHSENLAATFQVDCANHTLLRQEINLNRKKEGLLPPLARVVKAWRQEGDRVCLACSSGRHAEQMARMLAQHDLNVAVCQAPATALPDIPGKDVLIFDQPLGNGFDLPAEKLHWLSEQELFGERRLSSAAKKGRKPPPGPAVSFDDLQPGDIVVHRSHGLGVYGGLITIEHGIEKGTVANDFLQITYQDGDRLYVPVDQINVISKYKGFADKEPRMDKLGGKAWTTTRKKVKEAVWKVAQDLLNLYARRKTVEGRAFSQPDELFNELEESFPFDETAGQIAAINDVLADITSSQSMDRLVCGDVGYGKTEVAVRAAFKVVEDSFQVAVLVPTTVLAEQHVDTFRERFTGFPVRIECLNRFRTAAEQKQIINDLASGAVDIVIATHRLLSADVKFRRLGLLVIDEEHRFGVTHKEKLKKLRANVDVLTLTATPIPRTLQLSLLGVRDLSVISTPPQHRRTVKTFIARHDDLVIREAVSRELQRNGQVFLVHNRVQSIQQTAASLQRLVPAARIAVAHGQMPGKNLEEIMVQFVRREIDVLVCTTIIESGLDIPNANTIIITRADRLGLAEIYQLRGRVGRSSEQAYAYLLVPSLDGLSKDARQRLQALMDYNELGGGFKLALSDLQIRGGGNILGESQSGNIAAVGYDLYLDLLQRTVEDLKRREEGAEADAEEEIEPEIRFSFSAYLPQDFIPDTSQRYIAYRRITVIDSPEESLDLQSELRDRYGPLPPAAQHLFALVAIKNDLRRLRIIRLEQGPSALAFTFHATTPVTPEKILTLVAKNSRTMRFTPDSKLLVQPPASAAPADLLAAAKNVLHALSGDAKT